MKLSFANAALVALGLSLLAGIAGAQPRATSKNECVAEDGSGRRVSCPVANRRQGDRPVNECMTDEGYGRRLPCGIGPK